MTFPLFFLVASVFLRIVRQDYPSLFAIICNYFTLVILKSSLFHLKSSLFQKYSKLYIISLSAEVHSISCAHAVDVVLFVTRVMP